jgi:hypothetical protein
MNCTDCQIWKQHDWQGLVEWVSKKRGCEPIPEVKKKVNEKLGRV